MTDSLSDPEDWALVAKYIDGTATGAERARVERWIAADPSRRAIVDELRVAARDAASLVAPASPAADRVADDVAWRRLRTAIRPRETRTPRIASVSRRSLGLWAIAAAALVAIGIEGASRLVVARRNQWQAYHAAAGERETVTLGDGTQFTLAPESHLRVPLDYNAGNRTVRLDGEAFFAVVHDGAHPFRVRTGRVVTTDVGTRFDVRAYPSDTLVRVGVVEGRVAVASGARPVGNLTAGDVAQIDSIGETTVAHGSDVQAYLAWTRGTLAFQRAPMRVVLAELARWYDVRFTTLDPRLAGVRLTATYERESLDEVLDQLGSVIGARVERHGHDVTLTATVNRSR